MLTTVIEEELPGDEGPEIEELADGKAPDGEAPDSGDIIEVIYQPPTPDPAPDSPIWDIEKDDQSSEEPPAQAAPVRARPKMVSPTKGQPVLFEHVAPIPSTSAKPAAPMAPASFPLLKTKTTLTPAAKANKAVALAAKPTTSSAKPSTSAAKPSMPTTKPSTSAAKPSTSTKVEAQGPEQILEYTVPKHAPASKSVTQGSKCASTSKKSDEAPAMKKAKKAPTVVLSSSDAEVVEGLFIDGLVNKKVAGNLAAAALMDSQRDQYLLKEQLGEANAKIEKLREELQDYKLKEEVQKRMKELGVVFNPDGSASIPTTVAAQIALTTPTVPNAPATGNPTDPEFTNAKFRDTLQKYLQCNNLTIVNEWEAYDPAHPFSQSHPTSDDFNAPSGGDFGLSGSSKSNNTNASPSTSG
ncbi:hypothetical protein FRC11_000127 [Ceratobasidium sp. 423]|nr:hypothetical protein FRC11_000127 [Ceratobasidium sp. 423]